MTTDDKTLPLPWRVFNRCFIVAGLGDVVVSTQTHPYNKTMDADLALIVTAVNERPALLTELSNRRAERDTALALVAELKAEREAMREANEVALQAIQNAQQAADAIQAQIPAFAAMEAERNALRATTEQAAELFEEIAREWPINAPSAFVVSDMATALRKVLNGGAR